MNNLVLITLLMLFTPFAYSKQDNQTKWFGVNLTLHSEPNLSINEIYVSNLDELFYPQTFRIQKNGDSEQTQLSNEYLMTEKVIIPLTDIYLELRKFENGNIVAKSYDQNKNLIIVQNMISAELNLTGLPLYTGNSLISGYRYTNPQQSFKNFPKGSTCLTIKNIINQDNFFIFDRNSQAIPKIKTLTQYQKMRAKDLKNKILLQDSGFWHSIGWATTTFNGFDQRTYYSAAVNMNGNSIIHANFFPKGQMNITNLDECKAYNETAINFIKTQI